MCTLKTKRTLKRSVSDPDPDPHGSALALLNPDPYWECGSWSWSIQEQVNWPKLTINLISSLSKRQVCFTTYYLHSVRYRYIFSYQNPTFCDCKVWPESGSAWIRICLLVWLPGSGSALKWKDESGNQYRSTTLLKRTGNVANCANWDLGSPNVFLFWVAETLGGFEWC